MDEVKLQQITRVGGQRPAGQNQAKDPAAAQKWEQALLQADRQLDHVSRQVSAPAESARG